MGGAEGCVVRAVVLSVGLLAEGLVDEVASEAEHLAEGAAEVLVESDVDDGVEHGVGVAEPEHAAAHAVRHVQVGEERAQQRHHEEGQPADDEGRHDDAEGDGGFAVLHDGRDARAVDGGHGAVAHLKTTNYNLHIKRES